MINKSRLLLNTYFDLVAAYWDLTDVSSKIFFFFFSVVVSRADTSTSCVGSFLLTLYLEHLFIFATITDRDLLEFFFSSF